jgi:hypothetical protein
VHISSRTLAQTGYVVVRDRLATHAVIDVGPHGYQNAGHAHADALALTLSLQGRPLLIDPGTFTYTMDSRLRDHFRSSLSHNTVSIHGRSNAAPAGPFHWQTRADATLHAARHNEAFDWIEASHGSVPGVRHRRTLFRSSGLGWVIADEMLGAGPVTASAHWHFHPGWDVSCENPQALRVVHHDGTTAWLLHEADGVLLARGDADSGLGWHSPVYGVREPTWTARITRTTAAPFAMATWIGLEDKATIPRFERLATRAQDPALILRLDAGNGNGIFLFRPGVRDAAALTGYTAAEYESDARVLHYAQQADHLTTLAIADGSHALTSRDGWISIASGQRFADLSVLLKGTTLELHASSPVAELRIHGGALRGVSRVIANGRDIQRSEAGPSDTLFITSADWGMSAHGLLPGVLGTRQMDVFAI